MHLEVERRPATIAERLLPLDVYADIGRSVPDEDQHRRQENDQQQHRIETPCPTPPKRRHRLAVQQGEQREADGARQANHRESKATPANEPVRDDRLRRQGEHALAARAHEREADQQPQGALRRAQQEQRRSQPDRRRGENLPLTHAIDQATDIDERERAHHRAKGVGHRIRRATEAELLDHRVDKRRDTVGLAGAGEECRQASDRQDDGRPACRPITGKCRHVWDPSR